MIFTFKTKEILVALIKIFFSFIFYPTYDIYFWSGMQASSFHIIAVINALHCNSLYWHNFLCSYKHPIYFQVQNCIYVWSDLLPRRKRSQDCKSLGSVHVFNMLQIMNINGSGAVETMWRWLTLCARRRWGHGSDLSLPVTLPNFQSVWKERRISSL